MNSGKITCEILKKIRSEIAEANQIDYVTEPCTFKGSCIGTCPKCEAELRELEHQLAKKQGFPKTALIAGVTLSLLTGVTSCGTKTNSQEKVNINEVKDSITNLVSSPKDTIKNTFLDVAVRPKSKIKKQKYKKEIPIIQIINQDTNLLVYSQNLDTIKNETNYITNNEYNDILPRVGGRAISSAINLYSEEITEILFLNHHHFTDYSSSPQYNIQDETFGVYITRRFQYPENKIIEKKTMVVQLLIDKEGVIKDVSILKSADPEIDQQVKKIIESMPRWVPGKDPNGTRIDTRVKLRLKVTQNGITVNKLTYDEVKIIL